ncbi:MAG TPA: hypothetical protein VFK22_07880, partial [Candidatus Dormibacteraeota bacterium]|nr:hypothetical protein [Candidatus Dormibacteraeota bacterium]
QASFIERLDGAVTASDRADPRVLAQAYAWSAFLRRGRGEIPETSPKLKEALERASALAETLDDDSGAALPRALMGAFTAMTGKLREGAQHMSDALKVFEGKADPVSTAMISDFLAMTYARLGDFAAAEKTIADSERLAGIGDEIARVDVDITKSTLELERGDVEAASAHAQRCAARAEDLGAYACVVASNVTFGAAALAQRLAPAAKPALERGDEICRVNMNMAPMQTLTRALLGMARADTGDLQGGIAEWNEALAAARRMDDRYGEAQTLWARARAQTRGTDVDWSAALADIDGAITLFEAMEAKPALARALRDRSRGLRAIGRLDEADAAEERALEIGRMLGLRDAPFSRPAS